METIKKVRNKKGHLTLDFHLFGETALVFKF